MAQPLKCPMPPDCTLENGCTIEFVAIDPTTGADVSGVLVEAASIYVSAKTPGDLSSGAFKLLNPVLVVQQG